MKDALLQHEGRVMQQDRRAEQPNRWEYNTRKPTRRRRLATGATCWSWQFPSVENMFNPFHTSSSSGTEIGLGRRSCIRHGKVLRGRFCAACVWRPCSASLRLHAAGWATAVHYVVDHLYSTGNSSWRSRASVCRTRRTWTGLLNQYIGWRTQHADGAISDGLSETSQYIASNRYSTWAMCFRVLSI
jgi:hypothetical protein